MEVEEHPVHGRVGVGERGARVRQRAREAHLIAEPLEVRAEQQPDVRLVIYDEEVPRR